MTEWLEEGWVSVPAAQLRPIEEGITVDELAAAAREDYDHLKHQELKSKVDEILAFVTKMAPGDTVLTTSDERIYVGDITGEWTWQKSEGDRSNLRRIVEWRNADAPIDFADLPAPLPAKLVSGATIVDLTAELDLIDELTVAWPRPTVLTASPPATLRGAPYYRGSARRWQRIFWSERPDWRTCGTCPTSASRSSSTGRPVRERPIWPANSPTTWSVPNR